MILVFGHQIVSVIDHPDDPSNVIVRAMANTDMDVLFPGWTVSMEPGTDWPFRSEVSRAVFAARVCVIAQFAGWREPACLINPNRKQGVIDRVNRVIAEEYGPVGLGSLTPNPDLDEQFFLNE